MKKIVLINSYSDNNKGDLGIILGTISLLSKIIDNPNISAISSFEKKDPFFKSEHIELAKYVSHIAPTPLGRVYPKSTISKFFKVVNDFLLFESLLILPSRISKMFFLRMYPEFYNTIKHAELIISKGGSFICNRDNIIDKIRLRRELTIFRLCNKLKKEVVVLGQSIGPVYGRHQIKMVNKTLKLCKKVVLREDICLQKYHQLFQDVNYVIGYDMAFTLKLETNDEKVTEKAKIIGVTVKTYDSAEQNKTYINLIVNILENLYSKYKCKFHFIPHVTIDDDLEQAFNIFNKCTDSLKDNINLDQGNYSIDELLNIYKGLDCLIGTRLHSTIFSIVVNTPVINIAYHGTKAQGVFKTVGMKSNQFEIDSSTSEIINRVSELLINKPDYTDLIKAIEAHNEKIIRSIIE